MGEIMKNIKIIALTGVAIAVFLLFGCGIKDDGYSFGDDNGVVVGDGDVQIRTEALYGIEDYYIIRADLASDTEKEAMMRLKNALKSGLDVNLPSSTDWIGADQYEREREIVIGDTERSVSIQAKKGLAFGDFAIKKMGEKIVIVGGSDSATLKAVDFFVSHFINVYGGCLDIPSGDGYVYTHDYMFDSLTIDGTDIADFQLYASPDVDISGLPEYIAENVYGVLLPVAEEMSENKKYIIFDDSGLVADGFSIELKYDGNLYVVGSVDTAQYAVEYFKHDFLESVSKKSAKGNIAIQDNYVGNTGAKPAYPTRDEIMTKLDNAASDSEKFLVGQQGGSFASPAYVVEDFLSAVGNAPDVLSLDLFSYGLHIDELAPRELSEIVCQIANYAQGGGIVAVSAYFENPTGGWELGDKVTGSLKTKDNWQALLTEGTDLNKKFTRQLDCAATFLKAMYDNGITVVFKPFEAHNQSKYWYSPAGKGADSTAFKSLWVYTYNYLDAAGCDSLIWQYSPYVTEGATFLFEAYPGEQYVDLIGGVWADVGVKSVSDEFTFGLARHGKSTGLLTLTVSPKKISSNKDKQMKLFNCQSLEDAVVAAKSKSLKIPAVVMFGTSSVPSWLGEGSALKK